MKIFYIIELLSRFLLSAGETESKWKSIYLWV